MDQLLIEKLIEEVLKSVGTDVSVCSLGNEWSINAGGKLFHFVIDGEKAIRKPVPLRN